MIFASKTPVITNYYIGLLDRYIGLNSFTFNENKKKLVPPKKEAYTEDVIAEITSILDMVSLDDFWEDLDNVGETREYPFLHNAVFHYDTSFGLLQILWNRENLRKFWNDPKYVDKYGDTMINKLCNRMALYVNGSNEKWINKNILNTSRSENTE